MQRLKKLQELVVPDRFIGVSKQRLFTCPLQLKIIHVQRRSYRIRSVIIIAGTVGDDMETASGQVIKKRTVVKMENIFQFLVAGVFISNDDINVGTGAIMTGNKFF